MKEQLKEFIKQNKKICWEAELEKGEFCIGENKVREFFNQYIKNQHHNPSLKADKLPCEWCKNIDKDHQNYCSWCGRKLNPLAP
ncbi:MAG: hypothetical protein PVG39_30330 [Desulfobacteraceae bacterium]|jgi:hypothetical protein